MASAAVRPPVGRKAAAEVPIDWEDECRKEREKHNSLKTVFNELKEHNRLLHVKIRVMGENSGAPSATPGPREREDEQIVSKMYAENTKLKAVIKSLKEKNAALIELLEKKKRELALAASKNKSLKSASVSALPTGIVKPSGIIPEIDIMPAPNRKSSGGGGGGGAGGERLSVARPHSAGAVAAEASMSNASDNAQILEMARKYKAR